MELSNQPVSRPLLPAKSFRPGMLLQDSCGCLYEAVAPYHHKVIKIFGDLARIPQYPRVVLVEPSEQCRTIFRSHQIGSHDRQVGTVGCIFAELYLVDDSQADFIPTIQEILDSLKQIGPLIAETQNRITDARDRLTRAVYRLHHLNPELMKAVEDEVRDAGFGQASDVFSNVGAIVRFVPNPAPEILVPIGLEELKRLISLAARRYHRLVTELIRIEFRLNYRVGLLLSNSSAKTRRELLNSVLPYRAGFPLKLRSLECTLNKTSPKISPIQTNTE